MDNSAGSMASPADVETTAVPFTFRSADLQWVAIEDRGQERVALVRRERSTLRLVLGPREVPLADVMTVTRLAPNFLSLNLGKELGQVGLKFEDELAAQRIYDELVKQKAGYERFGQYDPGSVQSYFQYYGKLGNQQNMLQDQVRTTCYRRAILENSVDFSGKAVMDIGAGSGILSFFSAQAGASLVYAVEASSVADVVRQIADGNNFGSSRIEVVNKPLEAIRDEVQGKVDVLVSEPIGTFLFNERMIESYLYARDRFLRPGGKMFPNSGDLCIAPFSDVTLHWEQQNKNGFWKNTSFYGIDLTPATGRATKEYFRQPIVDYINPDCLVSKSQKMHFDFTTISVESLHEIVMPFDFEINQPCLVHGLAGWFDASFDGSTSTVVLSTAPWCPGTHWYQMRFLLETPLAVNPGQHIEGTLTMEANALQSYYVKISMRIQGTDIMSEAPMIDLKDPEYRFYTSPNSYCPPGTTGSAVQQGQQQNGATQQQGQQGGQSSNQYQQGGEYAMQDFGGSSNGLSNGHFAQPHSAGASQPDTASANGDVAMGNESGSKHRKTVATPPQERGQVAGGA